MRFFKKHIYVENQSGVNILDDLLRQLNLKKEVLSLKTLDKAYKTQARKVHPDKASLEKEKSHREAFVKLTEAKRFLMIFLDFDSAVEFSKMASLSNENTQIFKQINLKDGAFLLNLLHGTIKNTTQDPKLLIENGYAEALDQFLVHVEDLHQKEKLSFEDALDIMTKTASLACNPSEYQTYSETLKNYNIDDQGRFSAWVKIIAGWAAKICTFGHVGQKWIAEGHLELRESQVLTQLTKQVSVFSI